MDPHCALLEKLEHHPELAFTEAPGRLRIEAPCEGGFAVELHTSANQWTVYLGDAGFHETFGSADEVLEFVAWCYSGQARIRELWRGESPQESVLESHESGEWQQVSYTGYFIVPFWRKRREIVLRNPNLLRN